MKIRFLSSLALLRDEKQRDRNDVKKWAVKKIDKVKNGLKNELREKIYFCFLSKLGEMNSEIAFLVISLCLFGMNHLAQGSKPLRRSERIAAIRSVNV